MRVRGAGGVCRDVGLPCRCPGCQSRKEASVRSPMGSRQLPEGATPWLEYQSRSRFFSSLSLELLLSTREARAATRPFNVLIPAVITGGDVHIHQSVPWAAPLFPRRRLPEGRSVSGRVHLGGWGTLWPHLAFTLYPPDSGLQATVKKPSLITTAMSHLCHWEDPGYVAEA